MLMPTLKFRVGWSQESVRVVILIVISGSWEHPVGSDMKLFEVEYSLHD
jgi:hypothetical protein